MDTQVLNRRQRRGTKPDLFAAAVTLQQAGRPAEAERIYRRVLAAHAAHPAAWSNLGVAQLALGRAGEAVVSLRHAVALRPGYVQALLNLADALRATGDTDGALEAYRDAAALMPPHAMLHNNMGVTLAQLGRAGEAVDHFRLAVSVDPGCVDGHANLARTLLKIDERDAGAQAEAITALRHAIALLPGSAELHADLGMALTVAGDAAAGAESCRAALALRPDYLPAFLNLANALQCGRHYAAAMEVCRTALRLAPDHADLLSTLAAAATMLGALDEAVLAAKRALALRPDHELAWFNLGYALERQGDLEGAISAQRLVLSRNPGFASAELKLAHALLAQGDFAEGWQRFEARWRTTELVSCFQHLIETPRWQGEPLEGRRILLHWEQGLGDTLQLLRFVPEVARRGGRVALMVQPGLETVVPDWDGVTLIGPDDAIPPFDTHCSLFSLPLVLGLTHGTVPAPIPYLRADGAAAARWRQRLDGGGPRVDLLRVGLVWAGNPSHKGDLQRSIDLPLLAPLTGVPGVRLFSLQRELRPGDAGWLAGDGAGIVQLGPELADFGVTAAILAALDVLVAVDTSVCHMAGALGCPVWLMLPYSPEWRWAPDAECSRWYPATRLLRQPAPGAWTPVIARVAADLAVLAAPRNPA